jgi:hypothetical protein
MPRQTYFANFEVLTTVVLKVQYFSKLMQCICLCGMVLMMHVRMTRLPICVDDWKVLTDKRRIPLRSASVRTYTFFTTGFPRFLSIRGARGLLALNQVLI